MPPCSSTCSVSARKVCVCSGPSFLMTLRSSCSGPGSVSPSCSAMLATTSPSVGSAGAAGVGAGSIVCASSLITALYSFGRLMSMLLLGCPCQMVHERSHIERRPGDDELRHEGRNALLLPLAGCEQNGWNVGEYCELRELGAEPETCHIGKISVDEDQVRLHLGC